MDEVKTIDEGKLKEVVEEVRAVYNKYLALPEVDRDEIDKRVDDIWEKTE